MNNIIKYSAGIFLPFIGTCAGAFPALFMNKEFGELPKKMLLGFAAGVMTAASVWSLLIPAMEMTGGNTAFLPAVIGFSAGMAALMLLDALTVRLCGIRAENERTPHGIFMTAVAVTLHNIPEGMAVGVIFAGISEGAVNFSEAMVLSLGIAVQNFPEGAIISMPLRACGKSRAEAFGGGVLSGAVEPAAAAVTLLLTSFLSPVLPYILSFAAGAMIYVVINELIPDAQLPERSQMLVLGYSLGFSVMLMLDVILG